MILETRLSLRSRIAKTWSITTVSTRFELSGLPLPWPIFFATNEPDLLWALRAKDLDFAVGALASLACAASTDPLGSSSEVFTDPDFIGKGMLMQRP
jgi:hypothetical protein